MNSNEIAQMFAAQNAMFAGQAQYAAQIGAMSPASSLAAWGTPQAMGSQMMNMPGMRMAPRPMSMGASGFGAPSYGGGSRFAGGVMSAVGGISAPFTSASFGDAAMGVGMTGAIGGVGGTLAGTGFMAGAGAAMLPALPLAAAGYMGGKAIGTFVGGGQGQQMIQTQLGQFGHFNPSARSGQGFSRDDAMAIGTAVRSLANVPDMLTSVEELSRMIPKLKSMGVMQGVRDASEFTGRFRETIKTIRDVSKLLGTTMEEASEFFAHSRGVGFLGRQAQVQNVLSAQFTSGLTGMSMGQTMQMQAGGAAMARQVGGRGAQGATAVTNIAQRIEMARQSGRITEEMIQDVTGQSGAEGVGSASQRMYELMLNMRNSSAGRLIMAGAMKKDASGKVVLDEDTLNRLNRGDIGVDDLKRKASRLSDEDKISFMYRAQGSLGAQFAGQVDIGSFMQRLVGNRGRDAAARVLQMQGIGGNEQDIDMLMQLGAGPGAGEKRGFAERRARESYLANQTDPSKILARAKTRMFNASGFGDIQESGAKAFSEIGKAYDEFVDDLVGRHVISVSKEGAERLHRAFVGSNRGDLKKLFAEAYGDKGQGMKSLAQPVTGGGASLSRTIGGLSVGGMLGGMLGGGFGSLAGAALGGAGMGSLSSLRDTELAAFITGDRTTKGQFEHQRAMLGGMTPEAAAGMGISAGARESVVNLSRGIKGFGDMTDAQRLDALRDATQAGLERGTLKGSLKLAAFGGTPGMIAGIANLFASKDDALQKAAAEISQKSGGKVDPAAALALASKMVGTKGLATQSDVFSYESSAALAKKIRAAEDEVTSALGAEGATLIKNKPEARRLLMAMQKDSELAGILNSPEDEDTIVEKLKEKGYSIDRSDLTSLRNADQQITSSGKKGTISESISNMLRTQMKGDISVMKEQASRLNKGVSDEKLKGALAKFAASGTAIFTPEGGAEVGVQEAISDLVTRASKTSGQTRERLLNSAGQLRDAVEAGLSINAKTIGMSAEQVGRQFRLNEEDLASIGLTKGTKVTSSMVGQLQALAEKSRTIGLVAPAGAAQTPGDKDAKLMKILDSLDVTMKNIDTTIQVQAGILDKEKGKAKIRENDNIGAKGQTNTGP